MTLTDPDGSSELRILLPDDPHADESAAAHELRDYLRRISGADRGVAGTKISILRESDSNLRTTESASGPVRYIHVGSTAGAEGTLRPSAAGDLGPEGYRVATEDEALYLLGNTPVATRHAAYDLLERLGVRWFWPGSHGEHLPLQPRLSVLDLDVADAPSFAMRHVGSHHESIWGQRNRLGGSMQIVGVHSFGAMVPPGIYGPTHPEYFALVDGERDWRDFNGKHRCQLCTTNPEVIELCVGYIRRFFDSHPDDAVLNISPNDGGGFCECPQCLALDGGRTTRHRDREVPYAGGRIFTFASRVGATVGESHPDRKVSILAYHAYLEPPNPDFRLPDNVVLQLCLHTDFDHDAAWRSRSEALLDTWRDRAKLLAMYEYLVWRGAADLPRGLLELIPASIRRYHQGGVRLYRTQATDDFGCSGAHYWLAAKLLWNADADEEALLDEYYRLGFGAAGAEARRYYELIDERWRRAVTALGTDFYPGSPVYYLEMFPAGVLDEIGRLLAAAAAKADTAVRRARIGSLIDLHEYTAATMRALGGLQQLERGGLLHTSPRWPTHVRADPDAAGGRFLEEWGHADSIGDVAAWVDRLEDHDGAARSLDDALTAWDERERILERLNGAGVVDDWHVRHDVDRDYGFDPRDRLHELRAALPSAPS